MYLLIQTLFNVHLEVFFTIKWFRLYICQIVAGCTLMINIFQPRHSKRSWCVFVIQSCRAFKPWNYPKQCWYLGKFCQRNMSIFLSWFSTRLAQNYEAFLHCWAAEPVTFWLLSQRYGLKIFQEFIERLMMCNKLNPSISSRLIH